MFDYGKERLELKNAEVMDRIVDGRGSDFLGGYF